MALELELVLVPPASSLMAVASYFLYIRVLPQTSKQVASFVRLLTMDLWLHIGQKEFMYRELVSLLLLL